MISTRGISANRVSGISGGGVTWSRVSQGTNTSGTTTEIWYGPNVSIGTTGITITQASLRSAAVVIEYSGLLAPDVIRPGDKQFRHRHRRKHRHHRHTTQANELWIGGIGIADGRRTLNAPYGNAFSVVAFPKSGTTGNDSMVYALEKIVSSTGAASSGGTVSTSDAWSGAIATFKAASSNTLSLSGSAAANYTLTGLTGTVTITPKNLTVTGLERIQQSLRRNHFRLPNRHGRPACRRGTRWWHRQRRQTIHRRHPDSWRHGLRQPSPTNTSAPTKPSPSPVITLGGAQAGNYTLTQPAGLTADITPLPVTVAAVIASKTYDGTTTAPGTPTITPALAAGDTTTALSQSFQTPDAGTGNKVIIPAITINDGNNGANHVVTLQNYLSGTISPAAATVTLGNLSTTYDGSPKAVSVGTSPTGLLTTVTYGGSPTAPTDAGTYAVVATVTDPNHTGSASDTLVITANLMASWQNDHFSAAEITAGLADDTANPDGDDFNNLKEYILGTDPRAFTPSPLGLAFANGGQVTLSFVARSATGAGYTGKTREYDVEWSSNLADPNDWHGLDGHTGIVGDDNTVQVTLPVDGARKFFRLNVRIK